MLVCSFIRFWIIVPLLVWFSLVFGWVFKALDFDNTKSPGTPVSPQLLKHWNQSVATPSFNNQFPYTYSNSHTHIPTHTHTHNLTITSRRPKMIFTKSWFDWIYHIFAKRQQKSSLDSEWYDFDMNGNAFGMNCCFNLDAEWISCENLLFGWLMEMPVEMAFVDGWVDDAPSGYTMPHLLQSSHSIEANSPHISLILSWACCVC